ncbi:TPA: hypothetical protein DIC20_01960 [Candidatus Dependentiae bacterium]|nr:MAG: Site-2 protease [candidate division TM6 bacterium GW2011_GWF2_36_131]KKQ03092.1 MAG: Site-2 protease [candidate division TM6 bacterium GW2011_GWE2_36_25]KKQ18411.1 MAG: Site-2 protease [candidate division TM6 bacterium GW2011_GWA2_36_9]HBR71173.1 hypothetical protein [Candidatus Dependentiae bacterium]HCU00451.1 hypothetical protein [Candidatus Dependentiae bacterium]
MNFALIYQLKNLISIAVGLFGIGLIIGLHEFGHYLFARLFGVRAPSFSIGMGPKLISKKMWGTEFKISAIPLGGYVEIAGMAEIGQGEQKEAKATDQGSFRAKPYWQKAIILLGGILFNLLIGFILFVGLYFTGMPKSLFLNPHEIAPIIKKVTPGKGAAQADLQPGDKIIAINQTPTPHILIFMQELQKNANKEIVLTINRDNKILDIPAKVDENGKLGIEEFQIKDFSPAESFINSVKKAWKTTITIIKQTLEVFIRLFKKRTTEGIGGPLELISQVIANAKEGVSIFLFLLAFISVGLAIINLLPIPITDGGQLLLTTIEAIIRRPLPEKAVEVIHTISWILVMAFFAYLTFKDSKRLFWEKIKNLLGF